VRIPRWPATVILRTQISQELRKTGYPRGTGIGWYLSHPHSDTDNDNTPGGVFFYAETGEVSIPDQNPPPSSGLPHSNQIISGDVS